jgi:tryptophan-rich sensory protein
MEEEEETGKTALDRYHDRARTWTLLSVAGSVALALAYGAASSKASEAYQSLQLYSEIGSMAADLQSAYDSAVLARDLVLLALVACLLALVVSVAARVAAGLLAAYRES